ncbi:energy coupling factor transporter S component ThiW [Jeotgalibacillus proteolyticus]|uniref:Energy coupling factor transporter S component ThiW n=1 Tax=Jeotgalibacillus proteolyticus TaxID=2082395 RepID=A0A2S5G8L5_9BACL|nr:energy coupling factor transporter S component ThiW [Jeotgalibacillus proteolyticus]PPA69254.1 energy coupling factor transporter S component ThiW [Jeotgalibacillus proteolyticus]
MNKTRLMTIMAMFVAIGVVGAQFIWFPAGVARAYPVQHAVNVIAAITLGPIPAVIIAFLIGLVRNLLGLGSLLAFPGGMIGALLAGLFYQRFGKRGWAAVGEVIGTGFIGAWFAVPFAKILMGTTFAAWFFVPPFLISSVTGAALGWLVLSRVKEEKLLRTN